jgi:uncharacterized protein YjbJ (UPF0337 family)
MDKTRGNIVDREYVKGAPDKAKAAIKDAAGKITGDSDLQAEGKFDKAKGAATRGFSDAIRSDRVSVDHEPSVDDE